MSLPSKHLVPDALHLILNMVLRKDVAFFGILCIPVSLLVCVASFQVLCLLSILGMLL